MTLSPGAKLILIRICDDKPVCLDGFVTNSAAELFRNDLAYIEFPNLIKPTEKGLEIERQRKESL